MRRPLAIIVAVTVSTAVITALPGATAALAVGNTVDITGPTGSGSFGGAVTVLANGNYVVADEAYSGIAFDAGEVSLYDGRTNTLISRLTGLQSGDRVGHAVSEVGDSNFVVLSPDWDNGSVADAGAATWVSGTLGIDGPISASNSLVGQHAHDVVGQSVTVLADKDFVIDSFFWNASSGAATWASGSAGAVGEVNASNSLIGSHDAVGLGGIVALPDGDYVVLSPIWHSTLGAVTLGDGSGGTVGPVTAASSLVGASVGDQVGLGKIVVLTNGNFVVVSPRWGSGAGAATWVDSGAGLVGTVGPANSLVGSFPNDGQNLNVTALTNGNFVVGSPWHSNGTYTTVGAATWGNGASGTVGVVDASNSLVGSATDDRVGTSVVPLSNGNYVVASPTWDNGSVGDAGAVTWRNGAAASAGTVTTSNSLVGSTNGAAIGSIGDLGIGEIDALSNGNYVIGSPRWDDGLVIDAGATTWGNGTTGTTGTITAGNSLIGSRSNDRISSGGITALITGNYVVQSPSWANSTATGAGAATWNDGSSPVTGPVSPANSLVGTQPHDDVGRAVTALSNGNYVVHGPNWANGPVHAAGAATWGSGSTGVSGPVSPSNSLVGTSDGEGVGGQLLAQDNANYVVGSAGIRDFPHFGAMAWADGATGRRGTLSINNSLVGTSVATLGRLVALPGNRVAVVGSASVTLAGPEGRVGIAASDNSAVWPPVEQNAAMYLVVQNRLTASGAVVIGAPASNLLRLLYPTGASRNDFLPVAPFRLVDTRPGMTTFDGSDAGAGLRPAGSTMQVQVAGRGVVPDDALAATLNVTAAEPLGDGFVTVYPCGTARPRASSLNFTTGESIPNAVVTKIGASGYVCIYTSQPTQFVVDASGFIPVTTSYVALDPARLLETRIGLSTIDGFQEGADVRPAGSVTQVQVAGRASIPGSATTAVLNVTVTEPQVAGFVTAYPCGTTPPTASNINFVPARRSPISSSVRSATQERCASLPRRQRNSSSMWTATSRRGRPSNPCIRCGCSRHGRICRPSMAHSAAGAAFRRRP